MCFNYNHLLKFNYFHSQITTNKMSTISLKTQAQASEHGAREVAPPKISKFRIILPQVDNCLDECVCLCVQEMSAKCLDSNTDFS